MKNRIHTPILILFVLLVTLGCADENATPSPAQESEEENSVQLDAPEEPSEGQSDACSGEFCDSPYGCLSDEDCSSLVSKAPACTIARCEASGACVLEEDPTPGCQPEPQPDNAICTLSGEFGERVICPISVARETALVPGPSLLNFTIDYPGEVAKAVTLKSIPCGAIEECEAILVTDSSLGETGTITLNPTSLEEWEGKAALALSSGSPDVFLTEKTVNDGDTVLLALEMELTASLATPVWVTLSNPTAGGPPGADLSARVEESVVVISGEPLVSSCDPEVDPDCGDLPENAACVLSGTTGQELTCTIELVRASATAARPMVGEFSVEYDTRLRVIRLEGQSCTLSDCTPIPVPGAALESGHTVTLAPGTVDEWEGLGAVSFLAPIDIPAPLTEAFLDESGEPSENPTLMVITFSAVQDISETGPAGVEIGKESFLGAEGVPVATEIIGNRILISGKEQCPYAPGCGQVAPVPEIPENALCALSGTAGSIVSCPLNLLRESPDVLPVTSLQFNSIYDSSIMKLTDVVAENCYDGVGCFEESVIGVGAASTPTGHTFTTAPLTSDKFDGNVAFILTNIPAPETPITEAYIDGIGTPIGVGVFATLQFELLADIPPGGELLVLTDPDSLLGSHAQSLNEGGDVFTIPITVTEGTMVSGQALP